MLTRHPSHRAAESPPSSAAVLLLRVFLGFVLIYGTQDNVFSGERMMEFRDFVAQNGFPYPLLSARLSAYAQFVCGILILLGGLTRIASLVMVINFLVALLMVHRTLPFSANIAPLSMLVMSLFFVLHGAGTHALDARLPRRRAVPASA